MSENERLRATQHRLREVMEGYEIVAAERDRLRVALEKAQGGVTDYAKQYVALSAENDRLREALTKLINAVDPSLPLKLYRAIAHARTTLMKEAE